MKRAQGDALTRAAEEAFAGEDSSSSESENDAPARPANAFALLLGSDDDEDEEEEEEEREPERQPEPLTPVKAKKSKKKKKKKKASVSHPEEDAVDEVTAALRELGEEMPTTTVSTDDLHDLSKTRLGGTHGTHTL
jgi:outer membrane biosynthesis protein TonB